MKTFKNIKTGRRIITWATTLGIAALVQQVSAVPISLGTAANFSILGGSAVTFTAPTTTVTGGDVGVSPGTSITGSGANLSQTGGIIHNNDAVAAAAQASATAAYLLAASAATTGTILNELAGQYLNPGVYNFANGGTVNLSGGVPLTLDAQGVAGALFVFQVPSDLVTAGNMILTGGADECNIIWQVSSSATLNGPTFDGTLLALTSITVGGGVTVNGRLLAQNGLVSLIGDTIITDRNCQPGYGTGGLPGGLPGGQPGGLPGGVPAGVPDSGSTILILGLGLAGLSVFRTIGRQNQPQAAGL